MRVSLTPSVIIHQRPYRETSLLLEIFAREYGRVSLVAKGVRRNRKKSQSLYQANRKLFLSWGSRGDLGTLTEIEADGPNFNLGGKALISVFYINELLIRFLHRHESHPQLYDTYLKTLTRLEFGEPESLCLRYFEKQLLDTIGYGLVLDHDLESGLPISPEKEYFYSINEGPFLTKSGSTKGVSVSGKTLLALDSENLDESCSISEIKQVMRLTLNSYLGDKPLASRELFKAYARHYK
ncbi:MAG: DNA repair protein RecO [Gammaproteobacteria bacterium]|nr:DNA repair protein RecO [Gammaproteobacteria bacterium]